MIEDRYMRMFELIIQRQNAIMDMLSSFMQVYAKDNNHAIEDVREECGYINDVEGFDN